uniref:Uncharacterized protein n=1 Tax=Amphilophus citrinellus TaxID=61819 RepID=A0A3Q0TFC1_AMPCI
MRVRTFLHFIYKPFINPVHQSIYRYKQRKNIKKKKGNPFLTQHRKPENSAVTVFCVHTALVLCPFICCGIARTSPWHRGGQHTHPRTSIHDSRYPPDITFAKCLCKGCIINGHEDHSYNSVPLMALRSVLIKTKCKDGTNTYRVKKTRINVPVGCTCARPISGN